MFLWQAIGIASCPAVFGVGSNLSRLMPSTTAGLGRFWRHNYFKLEAGYMEMRLDSFLNIKIDSVCSSFRGSNENPRSLL